MFTSPQIGTYDVGDVIISVFAAAVPLTVTAFWKASASSLSFGTVEWVKHSTCRLSLSFHRFFSANKLYGTYSGLALTTKSCKQLSISIDIGSTGAAAANPVALSALKAFGSCE
uniref:Uncharacterized protein n=1 Tax=Anopheles quadriannulatus TaxID=34691 RepID=A0A182XSR2_ANOQN